MLIMSRHPSGVSFTVEGPDEGIPLKRLTTGERIQKRRRRPHARHTTLKRETGWGACLGDTPRGRKGVGKQWQHELEVYLWRGITSVEQDDQRSHRSKPLGALPAP
jgi:hypothetical protein